MTAPHLHSVCFILRVYWASRLNQDHLATMTARIRTYSALDGAECAPIEFSVTAIRILRTFGGEETVRECGVCESKLPRAAWSAHESEDMKDALCSCKSLDTSGRQKNSNRYTDLVAVLLRSYERSSNLSFQSPNAYLGKVVTQLSPSSPWLPRVANTASRPRISYPNSCTVSCYGGKCGYH